MNSIIPIFLLHGLNSHPHTLYPLQKYLEWNGHTNTYAIKYDPDSKPFDQVLNDVD